MSQVKLPPIGHLHWLQKEGAKEVPSVPKDYGWISSGWAPNGCFYNYYISDNDLNKRDFSKTVYVRQK